MPLVTPIKNIGADIADFKIFARVKGLHYMYGHKGTTIDNVEFTNQNHGIKYLDKSVVVGEWEWLYRDEPSEFLMSNPYAFKSSV